MKLPPWFWKKLLAIAADILYAWTSGTERHIKRSRKAGPPAPHPSKPKED